VLVKDRHASTSWFQALAEIRPLMCQTLGRLRFGFAQRGGGVRQMPALHSSLVLGFGVDRESFVREFGPPFGLVWQLVG
jgi:hypothetical protein